MKAIKWIVVILVLAVLVLPGAAGFLIERQHQQLMSGVATGTTPVPLQTERYERGWFSTTVHTRFTPEDPPNRELLASILEEAGSDGNPHILVETELHHGPLPLLSGSLAPALASGESTLILVNGDGIRYRLPGHVDTTVGPLAAQHRYRAEAFREVLGDGRLRVDGDGADLRVALRHDLSSYSASGWLAPMRIDFEDTVITTGRVETMGESYRVSQRIWAGWGELTSPELGIAIDNWALTLTSPEVHTVASEGDGSIGYRTTLTAEAVSAAGWTGGEAIVDVELGELDIPALEAFLAVVAALSAEPGAMEPAAMPPELLNVMGQGMRLDVHDISIPTSAGIVELELAASLPARDSPADLAVILGNGEASGKLLAPQALVTAARLASPEADQAIQMMTATGMLRPEGDRYATEFAYRSGILTVNGFPMPLPVSP